MTTLVRSLLVVLALAGGLREAGSAACQSLCPWGTFLDPGPDVVAAEPSCGGCTDADAGADGCALPCSPDAPCPLFAPSPPALVERPLVSIAHADPRHVTVGPVEVTPGATLASADFDPQAVAVQVLLARPPESSPARSTRGPSLGLRDRALLI